MIGTPVQMASAMMHQTVGIIEQGVAWACNLQYEGSPLPMLGSAMSGGLAAGELTILAGPPGNGKSYLAMLLCYAAQAAGRNWFYQPIEDTGVRWCHRACAVWFDEWRWIGKNKDAARYMEDALGRHGPDIDIIGQRIGQNPREVYRDEAGEIQTPSLPHYMVLDWLKREAFQRQLIVIDPISMIDFTAQGGQPIYVGQAEFVQVCQGLAQMSGCHICLVAHTEKRPGSKDQLGLSDVQGAADITRFAHNVMLLDYHDTKTSSVISPPTFSPEDEEHRRTLVLAKCREGAQSGARIAMDLLASGGRFQELGIIQ